MHTHIFHKSTFNRHLIFVAMCLSKCIGRVRWFYQENVTCINDQELFKDPADIEKQKFRGALKPKSSSCRWAKNNSFRRKRHQQRNCSSNPNLFGQVEDRWKSRKGKTVKIVGTKILNWFWTARVDENDKNGRVSVSQTMCICGGNLISLMSAVLPKKEKETQNRFRTVTTYNFPNRQQLISIGGEKCVFFNTPKKCSSITAIYICSKRSGVTFSQQL